jgi:N-ethylmaleimide reductase
MSNTPTPKLFSPFTLGTITLRHRVVMAPLMRLRSDQPGDIPVDLMAEYYAQRTSPGGLIVTESTEITPDASAYEGAPGIYTEAQMAGWRKVTDAFHGKGGQVFLQLWHPGRVSHPDLTGVAPVSASATEDKRFMPVIHRLLLHVSAKSSRERSSLQVVLIEMVRLR